jgi:aspartyl-tRNA(Asn)/glutamyl-tRNA(Gln) amidotransferase subunit A
VHAPRKVLWSPSLGYARVDPEILAVCEQALDALRARGTEVVQVDDVFGEDPGVDWLCLSLAANLRTIEAIDPDGVRWDELDPKLAMMLDWVRRHATLTTAIEVQDLAHRLNVRLVEVLHEAPLLLTPTVGGQTPVGSGYGTIDGVEDALWVGFTYPFNLTRSPAGSVCAGFTADGMPVGLQVVGPQHGDLVVLRALAVLEDTLALDPICPYEP